VESAQDFFYPCVATSCFHYIVDHGLHATYHYYTPQTTWLGIKYRRHGIHRFHIAIAANPSSPAICSHYGHHHQAYHPSLADHFRHSCGPFRRLIVSGACANPRAHSGSKLIFSTHSDPSTHSMARTPTSSIDGHPCSHNQHQQG